jgi:hypothetical protein
MASCEGTITTDLATDAPVDPDIQEVVVPLLGIEFQTSGGTETLEMTEAELIDLMDSLDGNSLRVFTDEELPTGDYTGVRLLFDEDNTEDAHVIDGAGSERTLDFSSGDYADIDFSVDEEESSSESLILTLDLRLSLSVNDNNEYLLDPVLRAVPADEASELQGTVTAACISTDTAANQAAIYLFAGEDVTADDFDGQEADPYATAPVLTSASGEGTYVLRSLAAGTYTIALACNAEEENPTTDDDLDFQGSANVELDEGETLDADLTT